jgi:HNH endonuclease
VSDYKFVVRKDHPLRCHSSGQVLEHRLVMGEHLGYYLMPCQVVHHLNGDKGDNRIENLEVKCYMKHASDHTKDPEWLEVQRQRMLGNQYACDKNDEMKERRRLRNLGNQYARKKRNT